MSYTDFIIFVVRQKIQKMLNERRMSRNELFLLAMIKTAQEIGDRKAENKLRAELKKRFVPSVRFLRLINWLIENKREEECDSFQRRVSHRPSKKETKDF